MLFLVSFNGTIYYLHLLHKLTFGSLTTFGILYDARLKVLFAGRAVRLLSAGILRMLMVAIVFCSSKKIIKE